MNGIMSLVVLASAIWMAVDSSRLDYDKRDVRGLAAMSPVGWFFSGLLLWIIAFPLYLVKRDELKAAGERRRLMQAGGAGYLPPPQYGAPQYGAPQYGQPQYGQPQYGQPQYGQPQYPQPQYPQPQYPQPQTPLSADEVAEQIVKLGQMRESGLLTDDEFQQQKAQVLARM